MPDVSLLRRLFFYQSERIAQQYKDKNGKVGYSPMCESRFSRACKKRMAARRAGQFACDECPEKELTRLTDELLEEHLDGTKTLGAYQLRADGTAGWLCLDLDADEDTEHARANAREMAHLCRGQLAQMGLPAYLEYSGSKGVHLWLFCPDGCTASDLKRLGVYLVEEVTQNHGEFAGIHTEVFPKQTALAGPDDFGNLVKVPLGVHLKTMHRCVFVDEQFETYPNQLAFLSTIETVSSAQIAEAVAEWVPDDPEPSAARPMAGARSKGTQRLSKATRDFLAQGAPEGERNARLFKAAADLAGNGLSDDEIAAQLLPAALDCGLTEEETRKAIASACSRPRNPAVPASFNHTDYGNAERLVALYGDRIRYCLAHASWYIWDGRRWATDMTGEVMRYAKETVRAIYQEAANEVDSDRRAATAKWALRSESQGALSAMVTLAQTEEAVVVTPEQFDADPWLLNCLNGVIDLRTGRLLPHESGRLLSKLAPVVYDPQAASPLWETFLDMATGEDKALAAFLARAAGYSLTGGTGEEVLFFVHGPAASGKSTFLEALKATLGDYARTADFETFLQRSFVGGIRNDIADLAGARLVVSIEVDEGKRLAEGLVKLITGGDTVKARHLYKEGFEFRPQFKLWLAANHAPKVRDDDQAMWRRILRVPFEHVVPAAQRDPLVKDTLRDPRQGGPAILAWAVRGCLDYQRQRLAVPEVVTQATMEYRLTQDPLKDFVEQCCLVTPLARVQAANLRQAYEEWGKENGLDRRFLVNGKRWGERLKTLGCVREVERNGSSTHRVWSGIGLRSAMDEDGYPVQDELMPEPPEAPTSDEMLF